MGLEYLLFALRGHQPGVLKRGGGGGDVVWCHLEALKVYDVMI